MTDEQKAGDYKGIYVDNDLTYWKWTCKKPEDKPDQPVDPVTPDDPN